MILSLASSPPPSFFFSAASLAALFAIAACGGTVTDSPSGAGSSSSSAGSSSSSGGAATCTDAVKNGNEAGIDCGGSACPPCAASPLECEKVCASTSPQGCFDPPICEKACTEGSPGWNDDISAAFVACAQTDPLCFTTLEACMLKQLFPGPVAQDVKLTATGFDSYEGDLVYASFEKPGGELLAAAPQNVTAGAFSFAWNVEMPVDGSHLIMYYIDVDADGKCSPAPDFPGAANTESPPGFELPSWSVELKGPASPASFVCDYL